MSPQRTQALIGTRGQRSHGASPRVLLVDPWITDFAAFDLWRKPLGLLYVAAMLERAGVDVVFLSALDEGDVDLPASAGWHPGKRKRFGTAKFPWQKIPRPAPLAHVPRTYKRYGITPEMFAQRLRQLGSFDLVLVTSMMTYWYPGVVETIELIREALPKTPVVLGGVYATLCAEHARRVSGADLVAPGPAHRVLPSIAKEYLDLDLQIGDHPDDWPYPTFHRLFVSHSVGVMSSFGCPYRCNYCATSVLTNTFSERRPEAVVAEIAGHLEATGVEDVAFFDDAFLVHAQSRAVPLLTMLATRFPSVRFHFPNGLHARFLSPELASCLRKANVTTIRLALEGLGPDIRAASDDKVRATEVEAALAHLANAGFDRARIGVYVMVGPPGVGEQEVAHACEFVHSLGAPVRLCEYSPIPGTTLARQHGGYAEIVEEPLLSNNKALFAWDVAEPFAAIRRLKDGVRNLNARL